MLLLPLASRGEPPLADVHVHFKWNQAEVTSKEQAVAILRANAIAFAVVIGLPAGYALDLKALAPKLIVPIWSPYQMPADWSTWAFDEGVLARARAALASGRYFGIGELHLIESFPDRFMVGSDPVWPVERLDSWDEPDSGWEQYGRFVRFHREWLRQLPASISEKLRLTNARVLFKKPGSLPQSNPSEAGKSERRRGEGQSRDLSFNTRDRMYPSVCRPLCRCL